MRASPSSLRNVYEDQIVKEFFYRRGCHSRSIFRFRYRRVRRNFSNQPDRRTRRSFCCAICRAARSLQHQPLRYGIKCVARGDTPSGVGQLRQRAYFTFDFHRSGREFVTGRHFIVWRFDKPGCGLSIQFFLIRQHLLIHCLSVTP